MEKGLFHRTKLLLGAENMNKLRSTKVIIFGIGGVGSWCAESLIRTGISELTIVDSDRICITNVNRQLMANVNSIGEVKTEALKKRLLEINPKAKITALQKIYDENTSDSFNIESYDYVVDAIDSIQSKLHLIRTTTKTKAELVSSMGAALRLDPTSVQVSDFWEVKGCTLGRRMRKLMRKGELPAKSFDCVYSEELLTNAESESNCGTEKCMCPTSTSGPGDEELLNHEWCSTKASINGSLAHMTAIYGFTIAGLIIKKITEKN